MVQAFTKTGIITELFPNNKDIDSDNDERARTNAGIAQLFHPDTEDEEFEGLKF